VTGKRSDTAHHYIYNQLDQNKNLSVMCGKKVVRVLFEYVSKHDRICMSLYEPSRGTRAVGVEYLDGPGGKKAVAKASRLVILSAGALGSPLILQR
jgi:alcohol oxidase